MNRLPLSGAHALQADTRTAPSAAPARCNAMPVLDSQAVLQGRSAVAIEHNGAIYRLQTTRQGKLILTK